MFFPWGQRVNKWLFWIHWVIIELITFSLGWASGYFWRQVDRRCHICGKLAFLGYLCVFHVFSLGSEGQQMIVLDALGHYWINKFSLGWASGYFWCQVDRRCHICGKLAFLGYLCVFHVFSLGSEGQQMIVLDTLGHYRINKFSLGWASGYFWRQVDRRCHICGKLAFFGYLCVFHVFSLGSEGQQMIVLDALGHYRINTI